MLLRRLHQGLALLVSFILLCPPHLLLAANEGVPAWWAEQQIATPGTPPDDFAALNQGQLKNIAAKAAQAMEQRLPGGAGPQVRALVASWTPPPPGTNDYAAINLGQLKSVAQPFYDRLIGLGLASAYPWTNSPNPPDDYALALLGQAKFLFSFSLPDPLPRTAIPFFDNFDNQAWASLTYPSPPLVNGWQPLNMNNASGYFSVSPPYVAGFGFNSQLSRTFEPLPQDQTITLQFWIKIYPQFQDLSPLPLLTFNGIELALQNGDDLLSRPTGGTWQTVPVRKSWWAHNDLTDPDRRSYGFDHLTLEYHQATHTYSLYWNDYLLVDRRNYTPATSAALLTFGSPVNKGEFYIDDFKLAAGEAGFSPPNLTLDSDGDGIPDYWEYLLGSNHLVADSHTSASGTNYTYAQRYQAMATGQPDPAGLLDLPNLAGNNPGGGGENPGGNGENPEGGKKPNDADGDGFSDHMEEQLGFAAKDAKDYPPVPRYVVVDLGAGMVPKYISEQNGWIVSGSGLRWHDGRWRELAGVEVEKAAPGVGTTPAKVMIPAGELGICDIDNAGRVFCDGLITSQSGMSADALPGGVLWDSGGNVVGVACTTNSSYGAHRWIQKLLETGKTISHMAHAGSANIQHFDGYLHYNFGRNYLDTCSFETGNVQAINQKPWEYTPTWINRKGGLLFQDQPAPGQSLIRDSAANPEAANKPGWIYDARLHCINYDGMGVGNSNGPVYTRPEQKPGSAVGVGRVYALPTRTGLPVEEARWINRANSPGFMATSRSQVWLPGAQPGNTAALFGTPMKLSALVDFRCGWTDGWEVTGLNDAGWLIGTGWKIGNLKSYAATKEPYITLGSYLKDGKPENVNVPGNAEGIAQHGFLMLPFEVRSFQTENKTLDIFSWRTRRQFVDPDRSGKFLTKLAPELKICQWETALDVIYKGQGTMEISREEADIKEWNSDMDRDAFFVRVQAPPPPTGQSYKVRVWSRDNPESEYDDKQGLVAELTHKGEGVYQSELLYLVGDKSDAAYPFKQFQGKKRALLAGLNSQICFRFLGLGRPDNDEPDRVITVPVKKVVKGKWYVYQTADTSQAAWDGKMARVATLARCARERLAQAGVRLDTTIIKKTFPSEITYNNGIDAAYSDDNDKMIIPEQTKLLVTQSPVGDKEIRVIIVDDFLPRKELEGAYAFAVMPFTGSAVDFSDTIFYFLTPSLRSIEYKYTMGHEYLHVLGECLHPERPGGHTKFNDDWFDTRDIFLWQYPQEGPDVLRNKRMSDTFCDAVLESSYAQEP